MSPFGLKAVAVLAVITAVCVVLSYFMFRRMQQADDRLRKAQAQEAAVAYHSTVLRAWHEIVNALSAYDAEQRRRVRLAREVEFTRNALSLAREQYSEGVTDFLNVLNAERTELTAEQALATSTANVSANLVTLYKALGGGCETAFPDTRDVLSRQERKSPFGTIALPEGQ